MEQEKTEVLIPSKPGAGLMTAPVCITQTENNPEDSKKAADYYREVCMPLFLDKWENLAEEIDIKWDWMYEERDRRAKRDIEQQEDKK